MSQNTYFIDIHERYADAITSNYKCGKEAMAAAFGCTERTIEQAARHRTPLKVNAEMIGNYIAYRSMIGVSNAVAELNIRKTPDNFIDLLSQVS